MIDDDSGVVDLGAEGLKTGIPPKSAPEAYLFNVLQGIAQCRYVIANIQGLTDIRPYLFTRQILIMIVNPDTRKKLLRALDEEIKRIDALPISNEEKGEMRIITSQNMQGEMLTYLDEMIGIEKTIVIAKAYEP